MIYLYTTGGTIEGLEYTFESEQPVKAPVDIAELVKNIAPEQEVMIQRVFSKDSRFISPEDRNLLWEYISKISDSNVVVTHGTITMVETARYLAGRNTDKTIVLTGAFILGTKEGSDAKNNLAFAFKKVQDLETGVYIAMHDTIFNWDNVIKNDQKNRFEKKLKQ